MLITIPVGYAYNSIALILFVLYSLLSARKEERHAGMALWLPVALFALMVISVAWSINVEASIRALGKQASFLFVPIAFFFNRQYIRMGIADIVRNYSVAMCLFGLFFLGRAIFRYYDTGSTEVFFYHELSTEALNAIYLSAFMSVALFYFLSIREKRFVTYLVMAFLLLFVFLLSSKTILIIDVLLIVAYYLFYSGFSRAIKIGAIAVFCTMVAILGYYGKIKDRLEAEYRPNTGQQANITVDGKSMHNVSLYEAWHTDKFTADDYFNGSAFRLYQVRIFTEMLSEDPILFTGYGLNASMGMIQEKGMEHNVFPGDMTHKGYIQQNFHNQYVEAFADLGIFGLLLIAGMLLVNIKNAVKTKDFVHIAFAILMIALLLTESFLWRQRGVVFFTIFYCLFNGVLATGTEKEKNEKNTDNRGSRLPGVTPV